MARIVRAEVALHRHELALVDVDALVPGASYVFEVSGLPAGLSGPRISLHGGGDRRTSAASALAAAPGHAGLYRSAPLQAPPTGAGAFFCRLDDGADVYVSCRVPAAQTLETWK